MRNVIVLSTVGLKKTLLLFKLLLKMTW